MPPPAAGGGAFGAFAFPFAFALAAAFSLGGMSHLGLDQAVQAGECLGDLEELRRPSAVAAPEHREVGSDEGRLLTGGTQEVELALPLEPGKVAQVGLAPRTSVSGRPERRTPAASVAARHRRLGQTKVHLQPPKLGPKGYDEHICVSVSIWRNEIWRNQHKTHMNPKATRTTEPNLTDV